MERVAKAPLHNFGFPFPKWGTQRQLRCMKVSSAAATSRTSRFPKFDSGEGINEVREKIILDIKTAANKMKDEILRNQLSGDNDDEEEEASVIQSPSPAEAEGESQPWNLRTKKAASKVSEKGKMGKGRETQSPPRGEKGRFQRMKREREEEKNKEKERVKFSVELSRREVEDDFAMIMGQRPSRRPKRRPRNLQKQLDGLFPGLWLSEVTIDTYKVSEVSDNKKR